jgi:hypothetical protein
MIFSRKRNGEPIAALERELSAAQTRKVALDTKLATSQTALTQAIETRRQTLLESDDETSEGAKAVVTHLRDEVDGLLDAGEAIAARIAHVEARLALEGDRIGREAAAKELTEHTNALARAVEAFGVAAKVMIERAPAAIDRMAPGYSQVPIAVGNLIAQITTEMNLVANLARDYAAAIVNATRPSASRRQRSKCRSRRRRSRASPCSSSVM